MDHKRFVASMSPTTRAALNQTADAPGLRHLALHVGVIIGFGVWIMAAWPLWQLALLGQGIALCFLFTLEHEATHKTPFRTSWLNEWVGRACGLILLLPFEWFRYFHLAHHRHTNIPGKDPELLSGAKPETVRAYVIHISGVPYWWGMMQQIAHNAFARDLGGHGADYLPPRAHPRIRREARILLGLYALVLISLMVTPLLFWVWLLPCLLGQPFLRLYLLAEHGRCAFVANMFENTRTTYTNRILRFLAWNMPYHTEHHTLPNVPFHRLPDLHVVMQAHLEVTADGYAAFTADYARRLTSGAAQGGAQ